VQRKGADYITAVSRLAVVVSLCIVVFLVFPVMAIEPTWKYSEPGATIGGVTLSSDGSSIAVAAEKIWFFSKNGTLISKEPYGDKLAMTPDGSAMVSSYSSILYLFRKDPGKKQGPMSEVWETQLDHNVISLVIADDGDTIALTMEGSGLMIYSADGSVSGSNESYFPLVKISGDGRYIEGISHQGLTTYANNGEYVDDYDLSIVSQPKTMALSSGGDICVFNDDQNVRSVLTSNGSTNWKARSTGDVTSLAMTPGGLDVIVGTDNGHIDKFNETGIRIWSYDTIPLTKNYAAVPSVAVSDDGEYIAAGTLGGQILLLNSQGELLWSSNQTHDHIHHVVISANGAFILATGEETVYAFTTRYQDFNQAPESGTNTQQSTLETPETISEDPVSSSADSPAAPPVITSQPKEYSVIVTRQSPLSQGACLAALLILVIWRKGH
jgi:hypothetical protein